MLQLTAKSFGPRSTQFHCGAVLTVGDFVVGGNVVVGAGGAVVVVVGGDVVVVVGGNVVVVVGGEVVVVDSLVGETPLVASGVDAPAVAETGNATTAMDAASNTVSPTM